MGLMFELKLDGQHLVATPHPTEPGRTVGPVFIPKYDLDRPRSRQ